MFFRAIYLNKTTVFIGQSEGLPNIYGSFYLKEAHNNFIGFEWTEGCITSNDPGSLVYPNGGSDTHGWKNRKGIINASLYNPIYGKSDHVTPCNATIKVWQRIS